MTRTLTAIAIAAAAGTAFAQETFVVPDDFPTLQQVLDPNVSGIDPGDIVVLRDSVSYVGTFDVLVAALTIRAAEGDTPVLDANGAGTVITVNIANSNLTLEGLTIEDGGRVGNNDRGTGIDIANAGTVTIRDCVIRNNASKNGGGLFARNTDVVVEDSIFQNNSAPNGGGMFVDGASDVTIRNTTFLGNAATSGIGGGIEIQVTTANAITIEGSTFTGNSCTAHGGAADLQDAGFVTITDTVFTGNTATQSADDDGGALFIDRIEHLTSIRGCIFDSNLANGNGAAVNSVLGNGRRCEYVDTRFIGNEASGSAIAAAGGTIDFFNCEFIANTSLRAGNENGDGGAIRFVRFDDRTRAFGRVFNTIFDGNIGNLGGAVVIGRGSTVDILNSTFVNNEA
ncbi:MAG: hypothetical protein CMJ31_06035, partial [Phycisphaerae bacterium]|nr:hypothetical protein [Phycisphaerae bacterium]